MAKREPIRLPGNFDEALADLLKVKPPEKAVPKKKPKRQNKRSAAK